MRPYEGMEMIANDNFMPSPSFNTIFHLNLTIAACKDSTYDSNIGSVTIPSMTQNEFISTIR